MLKNLGSVDLRNVKRDYAWYTVATQFNYEEAYVRGLCAGAASMGLEKYIAECYLPIKHVKKATSAKDGTTKVKETKVKGSFSSYVFVRCILTSRVWNLLRITKGAAVVLTAGGIPVEVPPEGIDKIRSQQAPEGYSNDEIAARRDELEGRVIICHEDKPEVADSDFVS